MIIVLLYVNAFLLHDRNTGITAALKEVGDGVATGQAEPYFYLRGRKLIREGKDYDVTIIKERYERRTIWKLSVLIKKKKYISITINCSWT